MSDIWQTQFMSRCSHKMIVWSICCNLWLLLLIVPSFTILEINGSALPRRRHTLEKAKKSVEENAEASATVPDQIALAAHEYHRRKDNGYGNYELNLVRLEKEPRLHTQITAKYSTSITSDNSTPGTIDDTETAEEYVSKAVQRYGSRLRQPIRIASDDESESEPEIDQRSNINPSNEDQNYNSFQNSNNAHKVGYYEAIKKQETTLQSQKTPEFSLEPVNVEENKAPVQTKFQEPSYKRHFLTQTPEKDFKDIHLNSQSLNSESSSLSENDHPRNYQVYDEGSNFEGSQSVDRTYRTKHYYQPSYKSHSNDAERTTGDEKIRVSASTEIPKAEIMKQIEKSVIKYMQELEAEGKIITAPKEPKTYYKVVSVPIEEKKISSTTVRPIFSLNNTTSYHATTLRAPNEKSYNRYVIPKYVSKQSQRSENTPAYPPYSDHKQQTSDGYNSNVEFVYKIKSRTPLQTATVKTISKPYTLSLKTAPDQFDHSAALKNLEDFDLSHVVTAREHEERSPTTKIPSKLYFNTEAYQDINSLTLTSEKSRKAAAEYLKYKETNFQPEYKGYTGYFAEPAPIENEKESLIPSSEDDDGYPIINPYQYVLKKEYPRTKHELTSGFSDHEQSHNTNRPLFAVNGQKTSEYDSYNSKFNPNSDSYNYHIEREREREPVHIHKHAQRHAPGKRGKRGGVHQSHLNKKSNSRNSSKDAGSLALRPPPKS